MRGWAQSFDKLMKSPAGRNVFREFLRTEYSEENMLFWLACEELKTECNKHTIDEKARTIYEDYISILSPKEVRGTNAPGRFGPLLWLRGGLGWGGVLRERAPGCTGCWGTGGMLTALRPYTQRDGIGRVFVHGDVPVPRPRPRSSSRGRAGAVLRGRNLTRAPSCRGDAAAGDTPTPLPAHGPRPREWAPAAPLRPERCEPRRAPSPPLVWDPVFCPSAQRGAPTFGRGTAGSRCPAQLRGSPLVPTLQGCARGWGLIAGVPQPSFLAQVSLDSRVREVINRKMQEPSSHTFDDAQLQIYTLMHRDSYPRFLNSAIYKSLLQNVSRSSSES